MLRGQAAPIADAQPCPCGRDEPYARCCAPLHAGAPAPDAEALMRSRYSAFALRLEPYLLASWHPATRPAPEALALDPATKWLGLRVLARECDAADTDTAWVEFVARYRVGGGRAGRLHERSRFRRVDGRWYYVDGEIRD